MLIAVFRFIAILFRPPLVYSFLSANNIDMDRNALDTPVCN